VRIVTTSFGAENSYHIFIVKKTAHWYAMNLKKKKVKSNDEGKANP